MRNQPSRDIIRFLLDTEQDMNLTEQELDQWIEQRDQEAEEEINSILQKISAETMSAIPLESVEMNEATPIEDDWSEPEEIIEVSLHEPDISIAQNEADEAEKEIDVILERPEESQKRSKEDQPLVLVMPPTLPCLPVKFIKGVVIKERSQIFYTADTFVSDDHDLIDSYVLEVPDELLHPKEGMYDELPKAIDAPFIVFYALLLKHRSREPDITVEFDILILVLNLEDKVWDKFGGVSGIVECGMTGFAHDRLPQCHVFVFDPRVAFSFGQPLIHIAQPIRACHVAHRSQPCHATSLSLLGISPSPLIVLGMRAQPHSQNFFDSGRARVFSQPATCSLLVRPARHASAAPANQEPPRVSAYTHSTSRDLLSSNPRPRRQHAPVFQSITL
ncbi:hypothetical protein Sjap_018066 [Stephania japonica]|uniref:Uncharacterized protein n=1 Tax=Stephania japonica TaxID=461633 RepID=A0AAP0NMR2_9MAGN